MNSVGKSKTFAGLFMTNILIGVITSIGIIYLLNMNGAELALDRYNKMLLADQRVLILNLIIMILASITRLVIGMMYKGVIFGEFDSHRTRGTLILIDMFEILACLYLITYDFSMLRGGLAISYLKLLIFSATFISFTVWLTLKTINKRKRRR